MTPATPQNDLVNHPRHYFGRVVNCAFCARDRTGIFGRVVNCATCAVGTPSPDLTKGGVECIDALDAARAALAAPARRKYVKPFKWFKFNRARRYTAK